MILWDEEGYLEQIERFGYGTHVLEGVDLNDLNFVSGHPD